MRKPMRLTKKVIEALPTAQANGKSYLVRDTVVRGLLLAVNRTAPNTWKVQRDLYRDGRLVKTVRTTIGKWPELDVDGARTKALEVIAQIKRGTDPNAAPDKPAGPKTDSVLTWTIERAYDEYAADMRKRGARDRSVDEMKWRLETYLGDWKTRSIVSLTKAECRARHELITANIAAAYEHKNGKQRGYDGKRTANHVMGELKSALNFAASMCEESESLPSNPVAAVTMHKIRAASRSLAFVDLPEWWGKVQKLPNPLRRVMHMLGLLSGLRPGTLVAIERRWIALDRQTISIPHTHMKSKEPFELPLSMFMCELVGSAIATGDIMYNGSQWLFPTRSRDGKKIIATQVWKEDSLPSETGHILRHTYRTIAETTGIPHTHRRLLLDHSLGGMDAVYVDKRQLFRDLLASQEVMTATILNMCRADSAARASSGAVESPQSPMLEEAQT